jgi:hypothetical protein
VAGADVIAAVSATLEARLNAAMSTIGPPTPVVELHDLVQLPASDPPTVSLFLYQIVEDPTTRNRPKTTRIVNGVARTLKQPLGLDLQYMITAWAGSRDTEQRMLGRVLQVLYDDAVMDGLELAGVLAGSPSSLHISLAAIDLEDRSRVWSAIGRPYRLSINYEVRIAFVDPETETTAAPVRVRELRPGVVA